MSLGPLEMFGLAADHFEIRLISESGGVVASRQGPKSICDDSFQSAPAIDVLLVPGGIGTRGEVNNPCCSIGSKSAPSRLSWWLRCAPAAPCSPKPGCSMACAPPATSWPLPGRPLKARRCSGRQQARWVEDGKVFSSSGVSAGIDMALAVIAKLVSQQAAEDAANFAEYTWQRDADCDPFASVAGVSESA